MAKLLIIYHYFGIVSACGILQIQIIIIMQNI